MDSGDLEKSKYDVPDLDSILKTAGKSQEDLGINLFYVGVKIIYNYCMFERSFVYNSVHFSIIGLTLEVVETQRSSLHHVFLFIMEQQ